MNEQKPDRRDWLGVIGAALVAAAVTALAMPSLAHAQTPDVGALDPVVVLDRATLHAVQ